MPITSPTLARLSCAILVPDECWESRFHCPGRTNWCRCEFSHPIPVCKESGAKFGLCWPGWQTVAGVLPIRIVSQCREQARRVYYGVVFEAKKEIPRNVKSTIVKVMEMELTASQQLGTLVMHVQWNLSEFNNGTYALDSITITQTPSAPPYTKNGPNWTGDAYFNDPPGTYNYVLVVELTDTDGNVSSPGPYYATGTIEPVMNPAPTAPTNVQAKWVDGSNYTRSTVTWTPGQNATSQQVKRSGTVIATLSPSAAQYPDSGLTPKAYTYEIVAVNSQGIAASAPANLPGPPPPGAATGVSASWNQDYTVVTVSWTMGANMTTAEVDRLQLENNVWTVKTTWPAPQSSPLLDTQPPDEEFKYEIVGRNSYSSDTSSSYSNVLKPPPPLAPTNVVAAWDPSSGSVKITWAPATPAAGTSFVLYCYNNPGLDTGLVEQVNEVTSPHIDSPAPPVTGTYQYDVCVVGGFNQSACTFSNILRPPPPPQTPTNVSAVFVSLREILVSWEGGANTTSFELVVVGSVWQTSPTDYPDATSPFAVPVDTEVYNPDTAFQYKIVAHDSFGQMSSALSNLLTPEVLTLTLDPPSVLGGLDVTGTVQLKNLVVPLSGLQVALSANLPGLLPQPLISLPSAITIFPGSPPSASFTITTSAVAAPAFVEISAQLPVIEMGGNVQTLELTQFSPPGSLMSVVTTPATLNFGDKGVVATLVIEAPTSPQDVIVT